MGIVAWKTREYSKHHEKVSQIKSDPKRWLPLHPSKKLELKYSSYHFNFLDESLATSSIVWPYLTSIEIHQEIKVKFI